MKVQFVPFNNRDICLLHHYDAVDVKKDIVT